MSRRIAPPLNDQSVDAYGVQTLTSLPVAGEPTAYVPLTLAAASPVWFHPLANGEYLWINSRQWTNATVVSPGVYKKYQETVGGMWTILNTAKRSVAPVSSWPVVMPLDSASDTCRIVGCASRAPVYLYALSACTDGSSTYGLLQHYIVSSQGTIDPISEEILNFGDNIAFTAGVTLRGSAVLVYGTDSQNQVYIARKSWAKVGVNNPYNFIYRGSSSFAEVLGTPENWEFYTGDGWSQNYGDIGPLNTKGGEPLTTVGPMSFARYRNKQIMTTVSFSGEIYSANFWSSTQGRPFQLEQTVEIGTESQYVGSGVQLMPEVAPNPVMAAQCKNTIPYCFTTKVGSIGAESLSVQWGLYVLD